MSVGELVRRIWMRLRRNRLETDLRREMRSHLETLAEEGRDDGLGDHAAADAARRRFGNELALREAWRDTAGWAGLDRLSQDVRHAARALTRAPRFSAVALLVLAVGIGGNITAFSVVNALLLNPFPYPRPDRLVEIVSRTPDGPWYSTVRVADFGHWRDHATSFESLASYGYSRANVIAPTAAGFDGPARVVTGRATAAFLRTLGVAPALGRFFTADEDRPGGPPVVVLGHGAWMRRFGGRRDVLGEAITVDGAVRTVIGVMPSSLRLPGTFTCELWLPAAFDVAANMQPGFDTRYDGDRVVARLKDGVPAAAAETEIGLLVSRLERERLRTAKGWQARIVPWGQDLAESNGGRLRLLALIVGTGLLLVCLNLAGLLLARSGGRARETAVRASLGASRGRLVRFALTESTLLALAGGAAGVGIAAWSIGLIGSAAPEHMGLDSALRLDATVLAFALALSLLTGLAFGLVPAVQGSHADLASVLKGAVSGGGRSRSRVLSTLVVAEVALALVLLVGGGLMARSFVGLTRVETGIRPDGLLTFRLSLSGTKYDSPARRAEFLQQLLDRLRLVPGVVSAAGVSPLPMSGEYSGGGFTIDGRPAPANWREMAAQSCQATPRYFQTMGVPVRLGREFEDRDGGTAPVVLVNEALARRFFPGQNPLGHRLAPGGLIVGVVGDIRHNGPSQEPHPQIYHPSTVRPPRTLSMVVRAAGSPLEIASLVRAEVRALDDELPVDRLRPMTDVVGVSMADARLLAGAVAGFALFALALAAIGLYGVVAYAVSRRQYEIGIRIALGASRRQVRSLVLLRGAALAGAGIAIGVPAALAGSNVLASFLFGVGPRDPAVFVAVAALLLVVALLASYFPARRAAAVDPVVSLRAG